GMHGTYEANMSMQNCDVLIAVGARFDDRVIGNTKHFAQSQRKIVHIDIDPSSISKRVKVDIPIVGNVKDVLQEMNPLVSDAQAEQKTARGLQEWWKQINEWRGRDCLKYDHGSDLIKPQFVIETLCKVTEGNA